MSALTADLTQVPEFTEIIQVLTVDTLREVAVQVDKVNKGRYNTKKHKLNLINYTTIVQNKRTDRNV